MCKAADCSLVPSQFYHCSNIHVHRKLYPAIKSYDAVPVVIIFFVQCVICPIAHACYQNIRQDSHV